MFWENLTKSQNEFSFFSRKSHWTAPQNAFDSKQCFKKGRNRASIIISPLLNLPQACHLACFWVEKFSRWKHVGSEGEKWCRQRNTFIPKIERTQFEHKMYFVSWKLSTYMKKRSNSKQFLPIPKWLNWRQEKKRHFICTLNCIFIGWHHKAPISLSGCAPPR